MRVITMKTKVETALVMAAPLLVLASIYLPAAAALISPYSKRQSREIVRDINCRPRADKEV
jgi:hypothetical protein